MLPRKFALPLALALSCCSCLGTERAARRILEATGVKGGLVVHVGCGEGKLTAALRASPAFLVQGLETDPANVATARKRFAAMGIRDGSVTAIQFDGRHLPYADQTVNLLVAEDPGQLPAEEIMRVLVPGGVAYLRKEGQWTKAVRRRPKEMDDWTHFLHGPDNNAVSRDTRVGFPHHIQWVGWPRHSRDHELATSMHTMVSAGGRLFYVMDEAPRALAYYLPSRWFLVCRDAFNGVVLWKRPIPRWQPHLVPKRTSIAADLWRRLVATPDEVYFTETIFGPVAALDPATGTLLRTYRGTEKTEEIILADGVLYLVATTAKPGEIDRRQLALGRKKPDQKRILAVQAASGTILWEKNDQETLGVQPLTLAAADGRVFFQNTSAVVCLGARSGKVLWRFPRASRYARAGHDTPLLVVARGVVLSADEAGQGARTRLSGSGELIALDAATGKELWRCPCGKDVGAGPDVFVADGLVWVGENPRRASADYLRGRDIRTGHIRRNFPPPRNWPTWHHHRCYRDKATERFILAGRTGIEFLDLRTGKLTTHHWVRGICEYGIMPANGLIYSPPDQCACYIESRLQGFHALAPKRQNEPDWDHLPTAGRLVRGPAYSSLATRPSSLDPQDAWPTFRRDNSRSGRYPGQLPTDATVAWRARIGGRLTTMTCQGGRLYVAEREAHTLWCLDAANGKVLWKFIAGGRIDSPPTIASGLAVFGCHDGWVYALRASDGKLAWRFRAAPLPRQIVDNGQLASLWPVHGSPLVEDGAVYVAAGRSCYLDGGVWLYKLDLATGKPLIQKRYYGRDPRTGERINLFTPYAAELLPDRELPGILPDIFSADGQRLYLRAVALDRDLRILDKTYAPHLFSSVGFLEDSWWERSYWIYGVHFYSGARGHAYARTLFPGGRLLVFDDQRVYGYQDAALRPDRPGAFRVAKVPQYRGLHEKIAAVVERLHRARRAGKRGKRGPGPKMTLAQIKETFVWKGGIPQKPRAMQLTGKGQLGELIRKMDKFECDWWSDVPLYPQGMVLSDNAFWLAGPPRFDEARVNEILRTAPFDTFDLEGPLKDALDTFAGKGGGLLVALDKESGKPLARVALPSPPVFDGMAAAGGRLFLALADGSIVCLGPKR